MGGTDGISEEEQHVTAMQKLKLFSRVSPVLKEGGILRKAVSKDAVSISKATSSSSQSQHEQDGPEKTFQAWLWWCLPSAGSGCLGKY